MSEHRQIELLYFMVCALLGVPIEQVVANIEASRIEASRLVILSTDVDMTCLGSNMMNSYIGGFEKGK